MDSFSITPSPKKKKKLVVHINKYYIIFHMVRFYKEMLFLTGIIFYVIFLVCLLLINYLILKDSFHGCSITLNLTINCLNKSHSLINKSRITG